MKPVIEISHLSKRYKIGHETRSIHPTIKEQLVRLAKLPFGGQDEVTEEFWALKDVSFEVFKGEAVGVVGKNGSGKSTLLKILSRIVDPTEGQITLRGKVASLLEVGTGFHPELTGRENIYFNGSILGMSKKEIDSKFSDIVAFAEIEQFLDTPVKYYSSGMYVRLAFAVAAHLDPEILIVDEVLAVGDSQFQEKCLAHMDKVSRGGTTIFFVSHNMNLVRKLCSRGLLLTKGVAKTYDDINELAADYLVRSTVQKKGKGVVVEVEKHTFSGFRVNGAALNDTVVIPSGDPITIEAKYKNSGKPADLLIGYGIKNTVTGDFPVFTHNKLEKVPHKSGKSGAIKAELMVPRLAPGNYKLELHVWLGDEMGVENEEVGRFRILETPAFASHQVLSSFPSAVLIDSKWEFDKN